MAPLKTVMVTSYDKKHKKVNEYQSKEYYMLSVPAKQSNPLEKSSWAKLGSRQAPGPKEKRENKP